MIPNLGEDEATILGQVNIINPGLGIQVNIWETISQVTAPQLILPTKTDSDNVQPGGLDETILREQVIIPDLQE